MGTIVIAAKRIVVVTVPFHALIGCDEGRLVGIAPGSQYPETSGS